MELLQLIGKMIAEHLKELSIILHGVYKLHNENVLQLQTKMIDNLSMRKLWAFKYQKHCILMNQEDKELEVLIS